MPDFDIVKQIKVSDTFRTSAIIGSFDIDTSHIDEHFAGTIDIDSKEWNVGLIVGGSGTGKTTIAKQVFPDAYFAGYEYKANAVIDDMPKGASIKDIEKAFTAVGFASPPSWLKPYAVLSNGEKMRVDLARCFLDEKQLIVFDEYTSVVNREVAKFASLATSKAIRRAGKQFIAVSCHDDIIDWLQPDWIFNTDEMRFFGQWGASTAPQSTLKYTGLTMDIKRRFGTSFGNIII